MNRHPMREDYRDYFDKQQREYRQILYTLHRVVEQATPGVSYKTIWGQPFYYYRGQWFCYLAYVKKWSCVELGFTNGQLLEDPAGILLTRGRKIVKSLAFHSLDDFINREEAILEIIQSALLLNEKGKV